MAALLIAGGAILAARAGSAARKRLTKPKGG
jgi:hypothetical protein